MKIRPLLIAFSASASLASAFVMAHPGEHDSDDDKLMPKTCEQLADAERYVTDVAFPEVKKLKEHCDAMKEKGDAQAPANHGHDSSNHSH